MFEDLFVLELANNHLGDFERAKTLINSCYQAVNVCEYPIKAAIKFQLRDTKTFVHKDFRQRDDIRYVRKVLDTFLEDEQYKKLYDYAKSLGFLTAATPFDETGVKMSSDFNVDIIKVASSDIKDISLLKSIALLKKPVIASFGGAKIEDCDNLVAFFELNNIELALNHCVCLYPTADEDLNLEKIAFLKNRYPNHTVGFSTHQTNAGLENSISAAYALGARIIERHIDIEYDNKMRLSYCTQPKDLTRVFNSYYSTKKMCTKNPVRDELNFEKEQNIIEKFTRGAYANKNLKKGHILSSQDYYFAVPYVKKQLSHNDLIDGLNLVCDINKDEPLMADFVIMS